MRKEDKLNRIIRKIVSRMSFLGTCGPIHIDLKIIVDGILVKVRRGFPNNWILYQSDFYVLKAIAGREHCFWCVENDGFTFFIHKYFLEGFDK